jgi:hypothetical protein
MDCGDGAIKDMQAHGLHQLVNRSVESIVGVNRNDIEDNNIGVYSPVFTKMGCAVASTAGLPRSLAYLSEWLSAPYVRTSITFLIPTIRGLSCYGLHRGGG